MNDQGKVDIKGYCVLHLKASAQISENQSSIKHIAKGRADLRVEFFCLNKTSTLGQSQKYHKDVATLVSFQLFTLLSPDLFFAHATYVLIMGRYGDISSELYGD